MSKKKQDVMIKERANFVYGIPAEGIPGCVSRGIDEDVASKIYDDMMDFAEYAFNKSHAACYAVVSYQTAYLKHYYPVEYMAALMTSTIDNPGKVAGYIMCCRDMGITLLPPDINQGEEGFSVDIINEQKAIRYALTAIKSIGHPIIAALVAEREERGPFTNLKDFIMRMSEKDINKKAIENFIKAGALDSLPGTRKQFMSAYVQLVDTIQRNKKNNMAGQLSLFDVAAEEQKEEFELHLPDVGEYDKEMMLIFEKEVLGIYISGHPLEEYEEMWRACITNTCADFYLDTEANTTIVRDNQTAVIGGIIADKTIKYTRNDKIMCFLQVEDLAGACEVIVFPKDYEKFSADLSEDNKVFIRGRVSLEEDKDGKLICERIQSFADIPKKLWLKFPDKEAYDRQSEQMFALLAPSDGHDSVMIFIEDTKQMKRLPPGKNVCCDQALLDSLAGHFGAANIKVTWDFKKD
jgi:DNA polymerase-3 subunit alpha